MEGANRSLLIAAAMQFIDRVDKLLVGAHHEVGRVHRLGRRGERLQLAGIGVKTKAVDALAFAGSVSANQHVEAVGIQGFRLTGRDSPAKPKAGKKRLRLVRNKGSLSEGIQNFDAV